jgi:hypothetical protein
MKINITFLKPIAFLWIVFFLNACLDHKAESNSNEGTYQEKNVILTRESLQLEIAKSVKNGDCERAITLLSSEGGEKFWQTTEAMMLANGTCLRQNTAKAVELFEDWLQADTYDYVSLARLGALYWSEDTPLRNKEKAGELFKKAIVSMGIEFITLSPNVILEEDKVLAAVWSQTPQDLLLGFVDRDVGPWDLPQPLQDKVKWLQTITKGNGQEIMEVAFHLKEGTGGFKQDHNMAFRWLRAAAFPYEYPPSYYHIYAWTKDPTFCQLSEGSYCRKDIFMSNTYLAKAAKYEHEAAIETVYYCLLKIPDYQEKDMVLYYWLLRGQAAGIQIDQQNFQRLSKELSEDTKELVKRWWDMDILDTPGYTKLGDKTLC